MKKLIASIKNNFLQIILSIIACLSWLESSEMGRNGRDGSFQPDWQDGNSPLIGTDISTGFDGGALAMGIICSVCIIMIVWIEINKNQNMESTKSPKPDKLISAKKINA
tara:strand:+ start:159 stop:485 length:327 start_codon:yes stop_codon:yes gene_type:complete